MRRLETLVNQFVDEVDAIEAQGVDRESLDQIVSRLAHLASRADVFNFERFPVPSDPGKEVTVYPLHARPDGRHPLYALAQRVVPGAPMRAAHMPHMHPTWAAAACAAGATCDRFYRRVSAREDTLEAGRELCLGPGEGMAMMPQDIHSVRAGPGADSLYLLMYGRSFDRAVIFDASTGRARVERVGAIAAEK